MDERALRTLARQNIDAAISPRQSCVGTVQPESGLVLFGSMALITPLLEDRLDVLGEID
jgi:hypothetical protein